MSNEESTVDRLKSEVLPALFRDPEALGEYGAGESSADALHELSSLIESNVVAVLAGKIGEVVAKLADANPQQIARQPSWFDRLLGREVERQVRYQLARKALDELLNEAEDLAERVYEAVDALDDLLVTHRAEVGHLRACIRAGREFLDENPHVGLPVADALAFDRPRERFARKLANLVTLLSSHEMSVTQMQLTRAQAVDMLDRFHETSRVLVPVWRQHTLALAAARNMDPAMVAEATKAHHALMRSLSQSLEGFDNQSSTGKKKRP